LNSKPKSLKPDRPDLSIVIPLFNEAESLRELHDEICQVCEKNRFSFEVIYVDDCSRDGSYGVLEEIYANDKRVKVLQFRRNLGKSDALAAGFSIALGWRICTMDGDLQDDPGEIPGLINTLDQGFDLVSGWKKRRRDPLTKRIPSWFWNRTTSLLTRVKIHDFNCGLKLYRREVIETIQIYGELYRYIPALAQWEGFHVTEIPVNHRPRKYGKTKFGASRFLKGFLDLITVLFLNRYTKRPLHVFGFFGCTSFLAGFGITLYLVILRITKKAYLSNRPLLFIGIVLLIIGIQFVSIGLLGEMISRSQPHRYQDTIRRRLGV
jgi:glycosyltransferase involved in cell wall biosynthesis